MHIQGEQLTLLCKLLGCTIDRRMLVNTKLCHHLASVDVLVADQTKHLHQLSKANVVGSSNRRSNGPLIYKSYTERRAHLNFILKNSGESAMSKGSNLILNSHADTSLRKGPKVVERLNEDHYVETCAVKIDRRSKVGRYSVIRTGQASRTMMFGLYRSYIRVQTRWSLENPCTGALQISRQSKTTAFWSVNVFNATSTIRAYTKNMGENKYILKHPLSLENNAIYRTLAGGIGYAHAYIAEYIPIHPHLHFSHIQMKAISYCWAHSDATRVIEIGAEDLSNIACKRKRGLNLLIVKETNKIDDNIYAKPSENGIT
ncbi:hypothetical protein RF11_14736 [Thelohanellus kitauei]|uniref:Uncharacterized protein n=1 Tax=Thelohanellus kitauei TaxID=669202 RepID=A0A0C2MPM6_THEKT|nr:hypothetical protein RF11_14736 [Thelohanellus kitauei]